MEQRNKPVKHFLRCDDTDQPAEQEPKHKENVVAAYIHLAITRHPLLLGLVCGYLLRLLTRGFGIG